MSENDFLGAFYEKHQKHYGFSLLWGAPGGPELENLDSKWTGKHSAHGWQSSKLASRQQNSKLASCCTSEENRIDLQQKQRRIRSLQAVLAETSANRLKLQQQKLQQSHCKAQLHERSQKQLCCDSPSTTNHSSARSS